jgi:hypothetical protein
VNEGHLKRSFTGAHDKWRLTDLPGLTADVRIDGGRAFFRWMPDQNPPQIYMIDLKGRGVVP